MSIDNPDIPDVDQDQDPPYEPTLEEEHSGFSWDPSPSSASHAVASPSLSRRPRSGFDRTELIEQLLNPFTGGGVAIGLVFGFLLRGCFVGSPPTETKVAVNQPEVVIEKIVTSKTVPAVEKPPPPAEKRVNILDSKPSKQASAVVVPKISAKKVSKAAKKYIRKVKMYRKGSYRIADIDTGGHSFKYKSQIISKPYRLVVDITGLNGTKTKSKINAASSIRPIRAVRIQKRTANKVRIVFDLSTSRKPRYNITRTSTGMRVSIRQ
jgi:hypothetical protein